MVRACASAAAACVHSCCSCLQGARLEARGSLQLGPARPAMVRLAWWMLASQAQLEGGVELVVLVVLVVLVAGRAVVAGPVVMALAPPLLVLSELPVVVVAEIPLLQEWLRVAGAMS